MRRSNCSQSGPSFLPGLKMPSHTIIEEIDEALESRSSEQLFAELLKRNDADVKAFLASTFAYLKQHSKFFDNPEASKVLARLLRDVNTPKPSKPPSSTVHSSNGSVREVPQHSLGSGAPQPPQTAKASPAEQSSVPQSQPGSSTLPAAVAQDQEGNEEKPKGIRPNQGNGANLEKFSWTQTLSEVSLQVSVPKGTRAKDCTVEIGATSMKVGLKGQALIIDGKLCKAVQADETLWSLDDSVLDITLQKKDRQNWWNSIIEGQDVIDTSKVEPESSKLSDLDGETRATVEKMMFDQRQKQLGRPTSEEAQKQEMLKKFMAAHPEMDFSNAKIS